MRVAIYDRDESMGRQLMHFLKASLHEHAVAVFGEVFAETAVLLGEVEGGNWFDVIFLETDADGMGAAYVLRDRGYGGDIVFCSATAGFAVDGYEVGACGYLLKPYDRVRLQNLARRLSRMHPAQCLIVHHHRAVVRVPFHEILFVESCNSKCIIHRVNGENYVVYRRLDDIAAGLSDRRFVRSHQSFLVNMDHVVKADRSFEMVSGECVAIRQRNHRKIREYYEDYINDMPQLPKTK